MPIFGNTLPHLLTVVQQIPPEQHFTHTVRPLVMTPMLGMITILMIDFSHTELAHIRQQPASAVRHLFAINIQILNVPNRQIPTYLTSTMTKCRVPQTMNKG